MNHVNKACQVMLSIASRRGENEFNMAVSLGSPVELENNPDQQYAKQLILVWLECVEDTHSNAPLSEGDSPSSETEDLGKLRGFFNKMWKSLGDEKRDDVRRRLEEIGRQMLCLRSWSEEERKKFIVRVVKILLTDYE